MQRHNFLIHLEKLLQTDYKLREEAEIIDESPNIEAFDIDIKP